ncbi:putative major pilin subunit [Limihaloglobus sulfuriphilus]|uniref:Putative major pilin subunit n=1 Tax=Limihaloglobus sulfuriphilus TaxID=1851148 RepID=A0A1Q2ME01_9BACT|nr:type II secretion system protein [Limihaloglobus sulfuriphilus]AQQ70931.1 putative major pilin subunit [Limihaloglobus sulfuriphilus]
MFKRNKSGFTLIELLVVISIIALLMSILLPSLGKARKKAREVICLTNLKQWGIMAHMYANDYNDSLHPGYGGERTASRTIRDNLWFAAYRPYHKDTGIIFCPEAGNRFMYDEQGNPTGNMPGHSSWGPYNQDRGWAAEGDSGSYGSNGYCTNPGDTPKIFGSRPNDYFWKKKTVSCANRIPFILDCWWIFGMPQCIDMPPDYVQEGRKTGQDEMRLFTLDRHSGKIGAVFLDGSLRMVGLKELWTLKWHQGYNTNGPWTQAGGVTRGDWPEWMRGFKDF